MITQTRTRSLPRAIGEQLATAVPTVDRYDLGFGLLGFSAYRFYRYCHTGSSVELSQARALGWKAIQGVLAANHRVNTVELAELYFYLHHFAPRMELKSVAEELLPTLVTILTKRMREHFAAGESDPYTGGFLPAWYLLSCGCKSLLDADEALSYLPDTTAMAARKGDGSYLIPTNIAHGLAFHATFLLVGLQHFSTHAGWRTRAEAVLGAIEERSSKAPVTGCYYLRPGVDGPGRLCLAYGDVGIAYAGWRLAKALGQWSKASTFLEQLHFTANRRSYATTAVSGNSLLYGRAGALLFFQRLADLTGASDFREAAAFWRGEITRNADYPNADMAPAVYDYAAMKKLSLFEGKLGQQLVIDALATDPQPLYHFFNLI